LSEGLSVFTDGERRLPPASVAGAEVLRPVVDTVWGWTATGVSGGRVVG